LLRMPPAAGWSPLSRPRRCGSARGGEPCAVPCHLCAVLGCAVLGSRTPRCPPRARRWPDLAPPARGCARLRGDYLLHPEFAGLLQEIELPVGLLDADVQLAYLPGQVIGLRPQLRHRQGGEDLQLRAQLPARALAPAVITE
jgi:hypothetical protein